MNNQNRRPLRIRTPLVLATAAQSMADQEVVFTLREPAAIRPVPEALGMRLNPRRLVAVWVPGPDGRLLRHWQPAGEP